jgi:N-acetylmuramoyl-L-alanine amidase
VLIELGYVSNKDDLKQLTSSGWQAKTATAIGQAIDDFFSTGIAGATAGAGSR